jgi:hypothetical protein
LDRIKRALVASSAARRAGGVCDHHDEMARWRELPTRRVFQGKAGNKIGQLEIPPRSYDARQRSWYVDARKADQLVTPSPIFGSI